MPLFINKVMVAGNLTRDPKVKFFANERAVADFGLAINRRYKSADGEQKEEVTFVDVECFSRTAELCGQYLSKGRNVFIEGSLKLDQWEAQDGSKRSKLKIIATHVNFIGGANDAPRGDPTPGRDASAPSHADMGDAEVPF